MHNALFRILYAIFKDISPIYSFPIYCYYYYYHRLLLSCECLFSVYYFHVVRSIHFVEQHSRYIAMDDSKNLVCYLPYLSISVYMKRNVALLDMYLVPYSCDHASTYSKYLTFFFLLIFVE